MRTWYTLFLLLLGTGMIAQSLRPVDLVGQELAKGERFQQANLLQPTRLRSARVAELDVEETPYQILDLDRTSLETILRSEPTTLSIELPTSARSGLRLQLVRVKLLADDFQVIESATDRPVTVERGLHYRGMVAGDEGSLVAISIFPEELMGLVAGPGGNYVIGKMESTNFRGGEHIIYRDQKLHDRLVLDCATPDDGYVYSRAELSNWPRGQRALDDCVGIFLEADDNVYQARGSVQATNDFMTGMFNQVAALYANEQIKLELSEIFVWTTTSPYKSNSSSGMLSAFQSTRTNWVGDLAGLVSFRSSGGIAAGFSGLCNPVRSRSMCFSNIQNGYATVPSYSWTVDVVAHEFGHLFGSRHTHACVWNGNGTAIDGCYTTEGSCPRPANPSQGGTVMSYCHLQSVGKDLALGFGPQPGNVMRNSVAQATCLQACGTDDGGDDDGNDDSCDGNTVQFNLTLDRYPGETTWQIVDASGAIVAAGGPYSGANTSRTEELCLTDGCYTFTIFDSYGDGICCSYGNGSFSLTDSTGTALISGGEFGRQDVQDFCVGDTPDDGGNPTPDCLEINFNNVTFEAYGAGQDFGEVTYLDGGQVVKLDGNAWKSIPFNYVVTENTILEFEFGSTAEGEIHGIGFDDDDAISDNRTFRVFGTQAWGISNFNDYNNIGYWKAYQISVGQFFTGSFDRLVFTADHDQRPRDGNAYFRNVRIYEGTGCNAAQPPLQDPLPEADFRAVKPVTAISIFPNPVQDLLSVQLQLPQAGALRMEVYNSTGKQVLQRTTMVSEGETLLTIETQSLPAGMYVLRIEQSGEPLIRRFQVIH